MKFGFIIGTSMNEFNVDYDVGALEVHLNPVKHIYWSFFVKIVSNFYPLTVFAKSSIIDVWKHSK